MPDYGDPRDPIYRTPDYGDPRDPAYKFEPLGVGALASDIGGAIGEFPTQAKGAIGRAMEGLDQEDIFRKQNIYDDWIREAEELTQETLRKPGQERPYFGATPGFTRKDTGSLGPSIAASAVGMGAGLVSGIAAGAAGTAAGGPVAGFIAGRGVGAGVSGKFMYRHAGNIFIRNAVGMANEAFKEENGRDMTPQEKMDLSEQFIPGAKRSGLWEALPEAASNIVGFQLLASPLKKLFGDRVLTNFMGRVGALYGTESTTETITGMGQLNEEIKVGMSDEELRSFTDLEDAWTTLKEVFPAVAVQTTLMGGGIGIGMGIYNVGREGKLTKEEEEQRAREQVELAKAAELEQEVKQAPDVETAGAVATAGIEEAWQEPVEEPVKPEELTGRERIAQEGEVIPKEQPFTSSITEEGKGKFRAEIEAKTPSGKMKQAVVVKTEEEALKFVEKERQRAKQRIKEELTGRERIARRKQETTEAQAPAVEAETPAAPPAAVPEQVQPVAAEEVTAAQPSGLVSREEVEPPSMPPAETSAVEVAEEAVEAAPVAKTPRPMPEDFEKPALYHLAMAKWRKENKVAPVVVSEEAEEVARINKKIEAAEKRLRAQKKKRASPGMVPPPIIEDAIVGIEREIEGLKQQRQEIIKPQEKPSAGRIPSDQKERQETTQAEYETAVDVPAEAELFPARQRAPVVPKPNRRKTPLVTDEDSLISAVAKLGGISRAEAEAQGIDPADFNRARAGIRYAFNSGQKAQSFDGMAETLRQYGWPFEGPNDLLDALSTELGGTPQYTPAGAMAAAERSQAAREEYESIYTGDLFDEVMPDGESTYPDGLEQEARPVFELYAEASRIDPEAAEQVFQSSAPDGVVAQGLYDIIKGETREGKPEAVDQEAREGIRAQEPVAETEGDLFGGKSAVAQAVKDREVERQRKMAAAPPVEAGPGSLFSGESRQQDIEDITGKPQEKPSAGRIPSDQKERQETTQEEGRERREGRQRGEADRGRDLQREKEARREARHRKAPGKEKGKEKVTLRERPKKVEKFLATLPAQEVVEEETGDRVTITGAEQAQYKALNERIDALKRVLDCVG